MICERCNHDHRPSLRPNRPGKLCSWICVECQKNKCTRHAATGKGYRQHRNKILKYKYGITLAEYEEKLEKQNRVCAICLQPEKTQKSKNGGPIPLAVDHNHTTGKLRGLLCRDCNVALGSLQENIQRIEAMSRYLYEYSDG